MLRMRLDLDLLAIRITQSMCVCLLSRLLCNQLHLHQRRTIGDAMVNLLQVLRTQTVRDSEARRQLR